VLVLFKFFLEMTGKNKKNQDKIMHELRTRVKLEDYGVLNVNLKKIDKKNLAIY
jgi:hypothetical protein